MQNAANWPRCGWTLTDAPQWASVAHGFEGPRVTMTITPATVLAIAGLVLAGLAAPSASAQTSVSERNGNRDAHAAYAQANSQRPRTRIRVSPRCFYRTESVPFPVPYECEAPGPGYVRECSSWLVQEARPSGTVIVPQMRCWWVRD
jgi:hypothetical protein